MFIELERKLILPRHQTKIVNTNNLKGGQGGNENKLTHLRKGIKALLGREWRQPYEIYAGPKLSSTH